MNPDQKLKMRKMEKWKDHPRLIIPKFLPLPICKELEFIHKSNCTVGYRPHVFSTTLSHLIATNSPHLIMPFIPLRESVKEKVEDVFGCEYELFVEFTGLISWTKGASIGWHSDDNRPYLKQRDFTAVCYLNNYEEDFRGGIFHFQDGEPANFLPMAGDLVIYSADERNIHCVDEITDGERITLTLWFSRNCSYDEDAKLISVLDQNVLNNGPLSYNPLPASGNMYWFPSDQGSNNERGFDICFARLFFLGYDIYPLQEKTCLTEIHSSSDISDVFTKPLKLARGNKLFDKQFANLLHALQAVQFYVWKQSILQQSEVVEDTGKVVLLSQAQRDDVITLKRVFLSSMQLDETIFSYSSGKSGELHFDWTCFSAAVSLWEEYTSKLHKDLLMHLPLWKENSSLFSVPFPVDEE